MSFEFEQKAGKIMEILTKIPTKDTKKINYQLEDVEEFQKDIIQSEENNFMKLEKLHQKIAILHQSLDQQVNRRQITGQKLIATILNLEKVLKVNLSTIEKNYSSKEKEISQKVDQLIKNHTTLIQDSTSTSEFDEKFIQQTQNRISSLNMEIQLMRKHRCELQDKIYLQFHTQMKQLKLVLEKDSLEREQRQNQMIQQLKIVYNAIMNQIKEQTTQRETNERAFLKILEQLVYNLSSE